MARMGGEHQPFEQTTRLARYRGIPDVALAVLQAIRFATTNGHESTRIIGVHWSGSSRIVVTQTKFPRRR
jgi:hypothetical protein